MEPKRWKEQDYLQKPGVKIGQENVVLLASKSLFLIKEQMENGNCYQNPNSIIINYNTPHRRWWRVYSIILTDCTAHIICLHVCLKWMENMSNWSIWNGIISSSRKTPVAWVPLVWKFEIQNFLMLTCQTVLDFEASQILNFWIRNLDLEVSASKIAEMTGIKISSPIISSN